MKSLYNSKSFPWRASSVNAPFRLGASYALGSCLVALPARHPGCIRPCDSQGHAFFCELVCSTIEHAPSGGRPRVFELSYAILYSRASHQCVANRTGGVIWTALTSTRTPVLSRVSHLPFTSVIALHTRPRCDSGLLTRSPSGSHPWHFNR